MGGIEETLAEVEDKLFRLSQGRVQKLTQLLEHAMRTPDTRAMAAQSLEMLRPRLKLDRPARRPNLARVMAQPFQSMLVSERHADPRRGRVRRSVLSVVWGVVEMQMDKTVLARLNARLTELPIDRMTLRQLDAEVEKIGTEVWPIASQILGKIAASAQADPSVRAGLANALGADDRVDDLIAVAAYLDVRDAIANVDKSLRPIPIEQLSDEQVIGLRSEVRRVAKSGGKAAYLVYFAMERCSEPTVLIPHLEEMSQYASGLPGLSLADVVRHAVLADFEDFRRGIHARARTDVSDTDVAQMSLDLLERAQRVALDAGLGADEGFKRAFQETRAHLRSLVTHNVISGALETILDCAAPSHGSSDNEAVRKAEARARALVHCVKAGMDLGLDVELAREIRGVSDKLEQCAAGLIQQLAQKTMLEDEKDEARSRFNLTLRMFEIVAGTAKAGQLFRQARAADKK